MATAATRRHRRSGQHRVPRPRAAVTLLRCGGGATPRAATRPARRTPRVSWPLAAEGSGCSPEGTQASAPGVLAVQTRCPSPWPRFAPAGHAAQAGHADKPGKQPGRLAAHLEPAHRRHVGLRREPQPAARGRDAPPAQRALARGVARQLEGGLAVGQPLPHRCAERARERQRRGAAWGAAGAAPVDPILQAAELLSGKATRSGWQKGGRSALAVEAAAGARRGRPHPARPERGRARPLLSPRCTSRTWTATRSSRCCCRRCRTSATRRR